MREFPTVESMFSRDAAYWGKCGDWLVVSSRHRDSDLLTESNWAALLALLGGERGPVAIERANHWAVGWVEYLCIRPTARRKLAIASEAHDRMDNYPVLDESDFCQRESDAADESWDSWGRSDFIRSIRQTFGDELADGLEDADTAMVDELWSDATGRIGCAVEHDGSGPRFNIDGAVSALSESEISDHLPGAACPVDYDQSKLFGQQRGDYAPLA